MALDPDQINRESQVFNAPTELWNSDDPAKPPRYLQPIKESRPATGVPGPTRPRVLRSFDPFSEPEQISTVQPPPPPTVTFAGSMSALRAMRVCHQYRVGFWGPNGPLRLLSQNRNPDPSQSALDQMYADFLLFNYLPDSMTPTREQFDDFAKPQKRQALMQASLSQIGVQQAQVSTGANAVDDRLSELDSTVLPTPVPFRSSVTTFCTQRVERVLRGVAANG